MYTEMHDENSIGKSRDECRSSFVHKLIRLLAQAVYSEPHWKRLQAISAHGENGHGLAFSVIIDCCDCFYMR